MGITNYLPSQEDVKSWIKMTDVNDDGKISLDEYEFLVLRSLEKAGIKIEYMWEKKYANFFLICKLNLDLVIILIFL